MFNLFIIKLNAYLLHFQEKAIKLEKRYFNNYLLSVKLGEGF